MTAISFYVLIASFAVFCLADYVLIGQPTKKLLPNQWFLHLGIFVASEAVGLLLPFSAMMVAGFAQARGIGLLPWLNSGPWLGFAIWALFNTLSEYLMHAAAHRYWFFWAFHRIHHCDELVDASTSFRNHPVETLWSIGQLSLLALLLAPAPEAILAWYLVSMLIEFFSHSLIRLPKSLNPIIETILVTPRVHRVHHSSYAPQTDSNYGGVFTFWDRLFGTYCTDAPQRLGLDDETLSGKKSRDFDTLLLEPFTYLWRRSKRKTPTASTRD